MNYSNFRAGNYSQNRHLIGKRNHANCYFVPPYIIKKQIEESKSSEQRKKAMLNCCTSFMPKIIEILDELIHLISNDLR